MFYYSSILYNWDVNVKIVRVSKQFTVKIAKKDDKFSCPQGAIEFSNVWNKPDGTWLHR